MSVVSLMALENYPFVFSPSLILYLGCMIALVSFPRSGNTFFRNLLFELYGLESSTFHREEGRSLDENWATFPVIKTHLLPEELPAEMAAAKVVYILRDGRDALVSLAHHRKDIVEPGTDYYNNLLEAIVAPGGSYFGGWSENVQQWTKRADLIIRYEDLIADPLAQTERLRALLELPPAREEKLPSFTDLKFGRPQYGAGSGVQFDPGMLQKNFRKGKSGSWKAEMPEELQRLFWLIHGEAMQQHGYIDGRPVIGDDKRRILIEVSKLFTNDNDGVKRYLDDLLIHLDIILPYLPHWKVDLLFQGQIQALQVANGQVQFEFKLEEKEAYEERLLAAKGWLKNALPATVYRILSGFYRRGPFRVFLAWLRENVIRWKHDQDDGFKRQLEQYDLIHLPLPQHYHYTAVADTAKLVTVHDVTHRLFPDFHTPENIRLSEKGFRAAVADQAYFLAISQATADDLTTTYAVPSARTKRIYEGVSGRFNRRSAKDHDFGVLRKKYGIPHAEQFLMTLSTIEPRKNIKRVITAFQRLKSKGELPDTQLLICGKKGWLSDDLFATEEELRQQQIYFTGFIDDEDLPAFYAHAVALCYVSLYEGFGLPLLEAMQCGTPVIYGQNSSMPEVVGAGGIGVDARREEAIQTAIQQIVDNKQLREKLAEKAWQQAHKFSLLKSAYQTLLYYEAIVDAQA